MCGQISVVACTFQCKELITVACSACEIMKYLLAGYTHTRLSAKSRILYRQFSKDVQGSWISSLMNMAWSLVSVYTLSFFPLDWAAELQGNCCLILCLPICRMKRSEKSHTCSLTDLLQGWLIYPGIIMNVVMWGIICVWFMCAFPQSALPAASWLWLHSVLTPLPPGSQMMGWPFHLGQDCSVTHSMNWKLISSLNTSHRSPLCLPPPLASDLNRALQERSEFYVLGIHHICNIYCLCFELWSTIHNQYYLSLVVYGILEFYSHRTLLLITGSKIL